LEALQDFPVVLLLGPRQVGKSTLVQDLARKAWPARYLTLDDRAVLDAALLDPDGFLGEIGCPVILDEVQRAPDLMRAIKLIVDRERRPGMFLLTGSANVLTLSTMSESLAGRVAVLELHPFSWGELNERPAPDTLERLFHAKGAGEALQGWPAAASPQGMREVQDLVLRGGFPTPALMQRPRARRTWFESYRQAYIERDLRELAGIEHVPDFNRLMAILALHTGQMLNLAALSRDVGLPLTTLRRYFKILEQTYLVWQVSPYFANVGKRLVKTPKSFIKDTGFACHLSMAEDWQSLVDRNLAGAMVETWVAGELMKMASLSPGRTDLWYWRTHVGAEVDFILECGGQLVGVEVKLSSGIGKKDLAGMRFCEEALGERWNLGVLLYGGTEVLPLGKRMVAVPFSVFFGRGV
jgi:predicted AAA+ superfamily ATPase